MTPQLPPGYKLDAAPQLPAGYTLDAPSNQPPAVQQPEGSAPSRFFSNLGNTLGGMVKGTAGLAVQGARAASGQLVDPTIGSGIAQSHIDQAKKTAASVSKAVDAITKGDVKGALNHYTEAFGHAAATAVPMAGPAAASIGEQAGGDEGEMDKYGNVVKSAKAPDIAGAAGGAAGLIGSTLAPAAIAKGATALKGAAADAMKIPSQLNPVEQSAVNFLDERGVPTDVGTRTGNKFVKALQATTKNSPLGAQQAAEFGRGTEAGLQRVGGELADEARPGAPATPESAGQAVQSQVTKQVELAKAKAANAYGDFQKAVQHPSAARTVPQQLSDGTQVDQSIQAPVDMRGIKDALEPQYNSMSKWMQPALRNASAGFQAIKSILEGPDYLPAEEAEHGLSGLKDLARGGDTTGVDPALHGAMRDVNQGIGAHATKLLQDQIDSAVADAGGPGALEALQRGRAATASKIEIGELAGKLRTEPVQTFNQLTWQHDTGIDFLRKVAEQAPDQMPGIGRAYVQQLVDRATQEGGFSKTKGLLDSWRNLGPQTQEILFPDPKLRAGLGNFFKGADMVAQNPNPSGTALVESAGSINPARWVAGYLGSKAFFTPKGIALLTDSLQPKSPGAAALAQGKIKALAAQPEPPDEAPPASSTPTSPPSTPPASGPGAVALQDALQKNSATVAASKAKLTGSRAGSQIVGPGSVRNPMETPSGNDTVQSEGSDATAIHPGATGAREALPGTVQPGSETAGAETQVSVPGSERQYKARYQVIELNDLQTSHNGQTFQPNPDYKYLNDRDYARAENQGKVVSGSLPGRFDPRYLLTDNPDASNGPPVTSEGHAMGGNGRGMIMQRVYASNPQGAQSYRNLLAMKAPQFGIDPDQIRGMKQPVLVREVDPSEFTRGGEQDAVTDFNKVGTASLRGSEKALADSRRVSEGTLDHIAGRLENAGQDATLSEVLDGRGGADILNRLIQDGVVSPQESAAYVDRGELTADGKTRISKLMLGRFFRDPQQFDTTPPSIRNKLERIAAPLAKVEGRPQWSLAQPMQQALDLIEEARTHGQKNLDDVVGQSGLFGSQTYSPEAVTLAKMLQGAKPNDLTQAVRQYAQEATDAEQGSSLFGEPPTPADSFQAAFGKPQGK